MAPPNDNPRVLRSSKGTRIGLSIVSPLFIIAGLFGIIWMYLLSAEDTSTGVSILFSTICICVILYFLYSLIHALFYRIELSNKSLLIKSLFKTRTISIGEYTEYSYRYNNITRYYTLTSPTAGVKNVKLSISSAHHERFLKWFEKQRLIDKQIKIHTREQSELLNNEQLGDTREQRSKQLKHITQRTKRIGYASIVLVSCFYGFGATIILNGILDSSKGTIQYVQVVNKSISKGAGKDRRTTYHLDLAPWGSRTEVEDFSVSKWVYDKAYKGGSVIIYINDGGLGIKHFHIENR